MGELGRRQRAAECEKSLHSFVLAFWHILEPQTPLVDGWPLHAMCEHLEAVTSGKIKRLLINISPGSLKSLLVNVFWPAWEWVHFPHYRYVTFSYSAHLTNRDNGRFRELVNSPLYKSYFGDRLKLVKVGEQLISNDKTGWKLASSVGGMGTGERGNRVICLRGDVTLETEAGKTTIQELVESKQSSRVLGFDHKENRPRWQNIVAYEANPNRPLVRVLFEVGEIVCTEDHPIFVVGRGYTKAESLIMGEKALFIPAGSDAEKAEVVTNIVRVVVPIKEDVPVFNVRVEPDHNYFANGILTHNCDDPHNVKERESEKVRSDTVDWFSSAMSNRLNDISKDAIVVIMQRVHQEDVSGYIISRELGYEHLMIPAEYEPERHCSTSIGWNDPRTAKDELFWPERFSRQTLADEKSRMGPYDYAGQYQQRPVPKGGAIIRDNWWQYYEMPYHGRFPMRFEYVVASLDPAYTTKQQNDYSALTVWGIWRNQRDEPKVMLIDGWQKRLTLHGETQSIVRGEDEGERVTRTMPEWGLVEWVAYTCKRHKVDRLLIEAKASGISVGQEISRLYSHEGWGLELVDPRGDKTARVHSIVPLFSDQFIHVPAAAEGDLLVPYEFADDLIRQCEVFPRGSHDDLVDTMSQALKHLRDVGLAIRREEADRDYKEAHRFKPHAAEPLYPC